MLWRFEITKKKHKLSFIIIWQWKTERRKWTIEKPSNQISKTRDKEVSVRIQYEPTHKTVVRTWFVLKIKQWWTERVRQEYDFSAGNLKKSVEQSG